MSDLQRWLEQEVQSGRLQRRRPFRSWTVPFGGETRQKRLWAYSELHRWVWSYCGEYQVYQELATDAQSIRAWFRGEGVALHSIRRYLEVYRERMRYWLLQGRRPYPGNGDLSPSCVSDSAHTLVARQMDIQGRRYILAATVQCALAGAGAAAGPLLQHPYADLANSAGGLVTGAHSAITGPSAD